MCSPLGISWFTDGIREKAGISRIVEKSVTKPFKPPSGRGEHLSPAKNASKWKPGASGLKIVVAGTIPIDMYLVFDAFR